ncbi:Pycsar system effector family protein [Desulfothermus naphthae]
MGEVLVFVSVIGLAMSCMLAVAVVFPKLKGSRRGYIFWESISEFESASSFSNSVQQLDNQSLTNELLNHVYELAVVCKEKYRILNWSLRIGAVAAVSTILYLIKG